LDVGELESNEKSQFGEEIIMGTHYVEKVWLRVGFSPEVLGANTRRQTDDCGLRLLSECSGVFPYIKREIDAVFDEGGMGVQDLLSFFYVGPWKGSLEYSLGEPPIMLLKARENLTSINQYTNAGVYLNERAIQGLAQRGEHWRIEALCRELSLENLAYFDGEEYHLLSDTIRAVLQEKK